MARSINAQSSILEVASAHRMESEGRTVFFAGEPVRVGKLSIDQLLGLAHVALRAVGRMDSGKRESLQAVAGTQDGNLGAVLALLDRATLLELISVLTQQSEAWVAAHFDLVALAELVDAVDEYNQIETVIAPFRRMLARRRSSSAGSPTG